MENTLLLHDTKKKQFKLLKQFPKKNRKFTNKYFQIFSNNFKIHCHSVCRNRLQYKFVQKYH